MRVTAIFFVTPILWSVMQVGAAATPTKSPDLAIRASVDGRCYFAEVVGQCSTFGETLVSAHKLPAGDVHIEVSSDAKGEVILALLKSLERVGVSPSRVGFVLGKSQG
jgi:hypothetical protein